MKLCKLLIWGLLFPFGLLHAQTDYRPGYVIKGIGDTIYGLIDYRGDLQMCSICRFKDSNNSIIEYSPEVILAYRFTDSKYYISRDINNKKVFLEYLVNGKVSFYYLRDENGEHFFLDKDSLQIKEIPYEEENKYVNGKLVFFESKVHIGLIGYFMKDAPQLKSKIEMLGRPDRRNLIKLAEEYHNVVCNGDKCIIYEKNTPFLKILPEIVFSNIKYTDLDDLADKNYPQIGLVGHIWSPGTNEKIYVRTGVIYSQLIIDNAYKNYLKIPFQAEYIYPRGFFRPRVAYGLNFYIPMFCSVSFNFGANFRLYKKLALSLNSEFEFNSNLIFVPKSYLAFSTQIGLMLMLN